jgi:predicted metalloprotease
VLNEEMEEEQYRLPCEPTTPTGRIRNHDLDLRRNGGGGGNVSGGNAMVAMVVVVVVVVVVVDWGQECIHVSTHAARHL